MNPPPHNGFATENSVPDRLYHGIAARLDRLPEGSWQNRLALMLGCVIFSEGFCQYVGSGLLAVWAEAGWSTSEMNATCVSITMLGFLVGSILMGFLSDLKGRRSAILASVAIAAGSSLAAAFAPNMEAMIVVRFIMGVGLGGCILSSYCVLAEYTPPRSRGRYAAEVGLVGNISLPIAMLCTMGTASGSNWRVLCFAGVLIALAVFALVFFRFPESPRWLAAQGRLMEADEILCAVEKEFLSVGVKLDRIDVDEVIRASAKAPRKHDAKRMLLKPITARRMIALAAALFAMNVLVYTITTWMPSVFLNNGASSSLSLGISFVIGLGAPFGIFLLMIFSDKHGRKTGLVVCLLILAVASYVWSQVPLSNAVVIMVYGFLLCSVLYYYSLLACSVYIGEQFHTCIRARGAGIANAIGRIASIGAPYLIGSVFSFTSIGWVYVISALVCLLAAVLVGMLGDETRYRSLEDIND